MFSLVKTTTKRISREALDRGIDLYREMSEDADEAGMEGLAQDYCDAMTDLIVMRDAIPEWRDFAEYERAAA